MEDKINEVFSRLLKIEFNEKDKNILGGEEYDFEDFENENMGDILDEVKFLENVNKYDFDLWIEIINVSIFLDREKCFKIYEKLYDFSTLLVLKKKLIFNEFGFVDYSFLDNRPFLKVIGEYGIFLWENKKIDRALKVFKYLLDICPSDNLGARQNILAIRENLTLKEMEDMFMVEGGYGLDAIKLNDWFYKNMKKYPKDFDKWRENIKITMGDDI